MSTIFDPAIFCSDEDILIAVPGDFMKLASDDGDMAVGTDGSFSSGTPWVLRSALDFGAQGVAAGMVASLSGVATQPPSAAGQALGVSGQRFVVDAVAGTAITLRRAGQPSGVGQPPGAGGLAGVKFRVVSFLPQLTSTADDMRRELYFDADPNLYLTAPDLRTLAILWTLADLYDATWRVASTSGQVVGNQVAGGDIWGNKALRYAKYRDEKLKALTARRISGSAVESIPVVPID